MLKLPRPVKELALKELVFIEFTVKLSSILTLPLTSNSLAGVEVPIPTLPPS